jgi:hypothetical protein
MIAIAIISNEHKLSGKLAKWATGSSDYHIAFVDLDSMRMYDMNLLFRRRLWPHYQADSVSLFHCPVAVTRDDLEHELDTSDDWYGAFDYAWFAVKKLFGSLTAPSFKGSICSEKVALILLRKGWQAPFVSVPSPADFRPILKPLLPGEQ